MVGMTVCVEVRSAAVTIVLDTTAPTLYVEVEDRVEPPDVAEVLVRSNEPIGRSGYVFWDSLGNPHPLGKVRVDDYTERVLLPSSGLPQGSGTLHVGVSDRACNEAIKRIAVYVSRPRAFDLLTSEQPIFLLAAYTEATMEATARTERPFEVEPAQEHAFETLTEALKHPYLMELDVDGEQ